MKGVIEKPGYATVYAERDLYKAVGQGHIYDHEMREAKREAKYWRSITKGKKHPEGMGAMVFRLPGILLDAFRKAHEHIYIDANDKPTFWCMIWHRYEDLRCVTWKKCPWCGKQDRGYSFKT